MSALRQLLRDLVLADVRFIVVGGVAVVLHGHMRATKGLDLVIDLSPNAARKAMQVMLDAGLRPIVPVNALDFDIEHKNMLVVQMYDPEDARRDVFVESPMDFEDIWARAVQVRIDDVVVHVAAMSDAERRRPDARDDLERVVATTTPKQRLEWLDEMLDLAHAAGALDKARQLERLTSPDPAPPASSAGSSPTGTSGSGR